MEINENAPGNISQQQGIGGSADNETAHGPKGDQPETPLPSDDESPVDEEMSDVDAADSVASEHPKP
ncbi:hypothetical protein [Pseudomonas putida]